MPARPTMPSTGLRFVIRPLRPGAVPAGLDGWADARALPSAQGGWRVCLHDPSSDEAAARRQLAHRVGPGFRILPVLEGEDGSEHYPTGAIVIRFDRPIDDASVQATATSLGLHDVQRTRLTDRQLVCRLPEASARYAPDVVAMALRLPGVERAWLEAESSYQRAP